MSAPGFELRKDDEALVVPSLALYLMFEFGALADASGGVLDFYQRAREALGDLITHCDLGRGFQSITPRSETMVSTWVERPQADKHYWVRFWGAGRGGSAASLELSLGWAKPWSRDMRAHRRLLAPRFKTIGDVALVRVTFPLEHPIASGNRLVDWIKQLKLARDTIVCGAAGHALNWPDGLQSTHPGTLINQFVQSTCTRFPSFDFGPPWGLANTLVEWDSKRDDYVYRIPRTEWLTLVSGRMIDELGGPDALAGRLQHPEVRTLQLGDNVLVIAGDAPQIADRAADRWPAAYVAVANGLRSIRVRSWRHSYSTREEWIDEWQSAFERSPNGS